MTDRGQLNRMEIATAIGTLRDGARTSHEHRFQDEANRQDHVADVLTHHLMRRKVGNAGGLGKAAGVDVAYSVAPVPEPSGASDQGTPPHLADGGSEAASARAGTPAPVGHTRGAA